MSKPKLRSDRTKDYSTRLCYLTLTRPIGGPDLREYAARCKCGAAITVVRGQIMPHVKPHR